MAQTKAQLIDGKGAVDLGALSISGSAPDNSVNLDASGRLLVGTSTSRASYAANLEIEATTSAASIAVTRNSNDANPAYLYLSKSRSTSVGGNTIVLDGDTLGDISFLGSDGTAPKIAAHIKAQVDGTPGANDMPGRLVFSTTADGASSPAERMRIGNTGRIDCLSSDGAYTVNALTNAAAGPSVRTFVGVHSHTGYNTGTISFNVYSNGNVTNANNSYAGISDVKLKENIVNAGSQWGDLRALQVRKFNFKEETGQPTHTQIGLIAQEAERVSPGLVFESPDRDLEGNDLGTVTKSVNYSVLYMKAVKALQEAMERIEQLETEMAAVKAQLA